MSDDDIIRDAVHELVAAAPAPKLLPAGGASGGRSYRWLAAAAAVLLVVGGVIAIAWSQSGDDQATPVATTAPAPVPTSQTTITGPTPTSAATTVVPTPTAPAPEPATTPPSTDSTASSTTTSEPVTESTAPATVEQANLEEYLVALADGRYGDAAVLLREGGLEYEARADLRPLFTEFGDVDDLAARLQAWCENLAVCSPPDGPPVDMGTYWIATWTTPGGPLTGFLRSGSFEGSPSVTGLPPRRSQGSVTPCPTVNVDAVREANLDNDPIPETVVITHDDGPSCGTVSINICNTALGLTPQVAQAGDSIVAGVLDPREDVPDTLLIGTPSETSTCGSTYQPDTGTGTLSATTWTGCWGNSSTSIGCRAVNGPAAVVGYAFSFAGGERLDDSTAMDVTVTALDDSPIDSFSLALPDQIDEAFQIVEPHCNGLPVITYG